MKKFFCIVKNVWDSNILKIVLILIIALLLLMDYYGLSIFSGYIDPSLFGTVGDWFSNIATLLTIILAFATIVNDRRLAEDEKRYNQRVREEDQLQKSVEEKNRNELLSQAVYVWITGEFDPVTARPHNFKITISNKTGIPVFKWVVTTESGMVICDSKKYGPILPEVLLQIETKKVNSEMAVAIKYLSFLGIWWKRNGADVEEVVLVERNI